MNAVSPAYEQKILSANINIILSYIYYWPTSVAKALGQRGTCNGADLLALLFLGLGVQYCRSISRGAHGNIQHQPNVPQNFRVE